MMNSMRTLITPLLLSICMTAYSADGEIPFNTIYQDDIKQFDNIYQSLNPVNNHYYLSKTCWKI